MKYNFLPRCHWNKQKGRKRKAKRSYQTKEEVDKYIKEKRLIDKYSSYKCPVCGKYHIGHKNMKYEKV